MEQAVNEQINGNLNDKENGREEGEELLVALGADHAGYQLKETIKKYLEEIGVSYIDFGCDSEESVHYPKYADMVCRAIQNKKCRCGVLCCGTGIGMSMAANKHHGIRAACCADAYSARMTRMHNDANVLCMGGRVIGDGVALDMVQEFLHTPFSGGKHQHRIDMFMSLEETEK